MNCYSRWFKNCCVLEPWTTPDMLSIETVQFLVIMMGKVSLSLTDRRLINGRYVGLSLTDTRLIK